MRLILRSSKHPPNRQIGNLEKGFEHQASDLEMITIVLSPSLEKNAQTISNWASLLPS